MSNPEVTLPVPIVATDHRLHERTRFRFSTCRLIMRRMPNINSDYEEQRTGHEDNGKHNILARKISLQHYDRVILSHPREAMA